MKKCLVTLIAIITALNCQATSAPSGVYFNIRTEGNRTDVLISLCLNGKGTLNCQNYAVNQSNLSIITMIPDHEYPHAGIRLITPGYWLSGCTPINNGYCLFPVSNKAPANIIISGIGTTVE